MLPSLARLEIEATEAADWSPGIKYPRKPKQPVPPDEVLPAIEAELEPEPQPEVALPQRLASPDDQARVIGSTSDPRPASEILDQQDLGDVQQLVRAAAEQHRAAQTAALAEAQDQQDAADILAVVLKALRGYDPEEKDLAQILKLFSRSPPHTAQGELRDLVDVASMLRPQSDSLVQDLKDVVELFTPPTKH
jgi:hypothetical protein